MANIEGKYREQIEKSADTYAPDVYAALSFFHSLEVASDDLGWSYVPISSVGYYAEHLGNGKIFAVGILPPTCNVTGKLLDRSATISNMIGTSDTDIPNNDQGPSSPGSKPKSSGSSSGKDKYGRNPSNGQKGNLGPAFWDRFVEMCNRLGVNPYQMAALMGIESGVDPSKCNPTSSATGLNQLMRAGAKSLGMTPEEWADYRNLSGEEQLFWVEKFFGRQGVRGKSGASLYGNNLGGYNNPDGSRYATRETAYNARNGLDPDLKNWPATNPPSNKDPGQNEKNYNANAGLDNFGEGKGGSKKGSITNADLQAAMDKAALWRRGQVDAALDRVGDGKGSKIPRPGATTPKPETTSSWNEGGASNAQQSQKAARNVNIEREELSYRFKKAQQAQINATIDALDTMRNTPPLRMLVNPESFKVSSEKLISDGNWTRTGPVIQHWGDNPDKIDGSGKIAGFYAIDATRTDGSPGITRIARSYSKSFQNFMSLWLLYRNNGGLWLQEDLSPGASKQNYLSVVGSIYIYYDGVMYIGSFDSFSITESDTAPHSLEYSFQFTVRAWFLLDRMMTEQQARTNAGLLSSGIPTSGQF
jgi:hypothetical protein